MQIFVVGGAVRDTLLNRPVSDIDYVVVGSTPDEMLALGYKQVGADFPVFLCPNGDEYALARTERKTGVGYHGFETDFEPSVTLEDDLLRRDLTINSMAVSLDNWSDFQHNKDRALIIDPHGGWYDLTNKTLRHTSDHFAEDPVRLLRTARFHAKYGFDITRQTINLMERMVANGEIDHLVPERVWQEIDKVIHTDQIIPFFWVLNRCNALDVLIPNLTTHIKTNGFAVRKASIRMRSHYIKYMLLFGTLPDPRELLLTLKAPNDIIRIVTLYHHAVKLLHTDMSSERLLAFIALCTNTKDTLWVLSTISEALSFAGDYGYLRFDSVLKAEKAIRFIQFSSLTSEQQSTLKGADIAQAICDLRLEAISK